MTGRDLEAVTLTVANYDPFLLPRMVQRAYEGGATLCQVLLAIDAGLCLTEHICCCPSAGWTVAHFTAIVPATPGMLLARAESHRLTTLPLKI